MRVIRLTPVVTAVAVLSLGALVPSHAAPRTTPRPGCFDITDDTGDDSTPLEGGQQFPQDPDLDITGVAFQTTPTDVKVFVRVADLKDAPAIGHGHRFEVWFTHNKKDYWLVGGKLDAVATAVATNVSIVPRYPSGWLNGVEVAGMKPTVTFEPANDLVIFSVTRAALTAASTDPWPDGITLTKVSARSRLVWNAAGQYRDSDLAQKPEEANRVYTVGVSPCFDPIPTFIVDPTVARVAYGDKVKVGAYLANNDEEALPEYPLSFAVGTAAPVTQTTNDEGWAEVQLTASMPAGTHKLTVAFAGSEEDELAPSTAEPNFVVVPETVKLTATVARSGATDRIVTVTVKEDDGPALVKHVVTWTVGGRKLATTPTDSRGQAKFKLKAGQTVVIDAVAVAGKYAAARLSQRV